MKTKMFAAAACVAALASAPAHANLLTNGDFESGSLTNSGSFLIGSTLSQWVQLSGQYTLATSGPSGSPTDDYAKHNTAAGGQDQKLVQFVSGSGISAGTLLDLSFAFIYDSSPLANSNPPATVSLIGITSNRTYSMFGGGGTDGAFNGNGEFQVGSPDVLLGQITLAFTNGAWSTGALSAVTGQTFAAIGVIVQSGCFDGSNAADCNNLRGFDNVVLNAVPSPAPLALLAAGALALAGIGRVRRRD